MKKSTQPKSSAPKDGDENPPMCVCCFEPIKVFTVGPCNHTDTCGMCNITRRLLYAQNFCPICKEDQTPLVLTLRKNCDYSSVNTSAGAVASVQAGVAALAKQNEERIHALLRKGSPQVPFAFHYTRHLHPSTPEALGGIFCDTPELAYAVSSLLEYACPLCSEALAKFVGDKETDPINPGCNCLVSFASIAELKKHVSSVHKMMYCDICLEEQKVFLKEKSMFASTSELITHMTEWDYGVSEAMAQLADDQKEMYEKAYSKRIEGKGGRGAKEGKWKPLVKDIQKGHPLCEFCDKRFYNVDQLYAHLNGDHFVCPLCERIGKRWQYFENMDELLRHYSRAHYLCSVTGCCLAFLDEEELRAHELCVHGIGKKLVLEPSFHFSNAATSYSSHTHSSNSRGSTGSTSYSPHFNGPSYEDGSKKKKKKKRGGENGRSVSPVNTAASPQPHSQSPTSSATAARSQHQRSSSPTTTSSTSTTSIHIVRPNNNNNSSQSHHPPPAAARSPTNVNVPNDDDDDDFDDSNAHVSASGIVATRGKTSFVARNAPAPKIKSRSAAAEEEEREITRKKAEIEQRRRDRRSKQERGAATYSIPESVNNKELIGEMTSFLSADDYTTFKKVSANFKNDVINAEVYIKNFFEIFGGFEEKQISIFLRLIAILPDKKRQKYLLKLLNKKSLDLFIEQCKLDDIEDKKDEEELKKLSKGGYQNSVNSPKEEDDDDDDDDDIKPLRVNPQVPQLQRPDTNNPYGTSKKDMDDNFPELNPDSGYVLYKSEGRTTPTAAEKIRNHAVQNDKEEFPPLCPASVSPTLRNANSVSYSSVRKGQNVQKKTEESPKPKGRNEEFPPLKASPITVKKQQQNVSKKQQRKKEQITYRKLIEKEMQYDEEDDYDDFEEDEHRKYVMDSNRGGSKLLFESSQAQHQVQHQYQPVPPKSDFPSLGKMYGKKKGDKKK